MSKTSSLLKQTQEMYLGNLQQLEESIKLNCNIQNWESLEVQKFVPDSELLEIAQGSNIQNTKTCNVDVEFISDSKDTGVVQKLSICGDGNRLRNGIEFASDMEITDQNSRIHDDTNRLTNDIEFISESKIMGVVQKSSICETQKRLVDSLEFISEIDLSAHDTHKRSVKPTEKDTFNVDTITCKELIERKLSELDNISKMFDCSDISPPLPPKLSVNFESIKDCNAETNTNTYEMNSPGLTDKDIEKSVEYDTKLFESVSNLKTSTVDGRSPPVPPKPSVRFEPIMHVSGAARTGTCEMNVPKQAQNSIENGTEHRKFVRNSTSIVDDTAPPVPPKPTVIFEPIVYSNAATNTDSREWKFQTLADKETPKSIENELHKSACNLTPTIFNGTCPPVPPKRTVRFDPTKYSHVVSYSEISGLNCSTLLDGEISQNSTSNDYCSFEETSFFDSNKRSVHFEPRKYYHLIFEADLNSRFSSLSETEDNSEKDKHSIGHKDLENLNQTVSATTLNEIDNGDLVDGNLSDVGIEKELTDDTHTILFQSLDNHGIFNGNNEICFRRVTI